MDLKPGSIFENKFEIIERIGAGGMGTVYKANDLTLLRTIVLKILSQAYNAKAFLRFQNEAKVLGKLKHAAIAEIYDVNVTADGIAYLALEFVDGITLEKFIESDTVLPLPQMIQLFIELAEGLWHAHQLGIIHRDIKPGNIMLVGTDDGFFAPVLLDFGIAKYDTACDSEQRLTERGAIIGSPLYMSPEQCRGADITAASDQYSLGCVIFECLTGVPPFQGETAYDTIQAHMNRPCPDPLTSSKLPITREMSEDIIRMLSKDPAARFANMEEFITAFIEHRELAIEQAHEEANNSVPEERLENYNVKRFLTPKWIAILGIFAVSCFYLSVYLAGQEVKLSVVQPKSGNLDVTKEMDTQIREEPENGVRVWFLTDDSLALISKRKLSRINVAGTNTTDETLKSFSNSKNSLVNLDLRGTDVKTLENISMFPHMQWLELSDTAVTDEALKNVEQLKQLQILELNDCQNITKKSLRTFENCPSLHSVMLRGTSIPKADLMALQKRMPRTSFPPVAPTSPLNELRKRAPVLARARKSEAALEIYRKIIDKIISARGSDSPMLIEFLIAAASAEIDLGREAEARRDLDRATILAKKIDFKTLLIQILNFKNQMAIRFDKSVQKQIALLREQGKLIEEMGLNDSGIGRNNARMLAHALTMTGSFDEAERLLMKCKKFDSAQLKLKHITSEIRDGAAMCLGNDLSGLGTLALRRKDFGAAERFYRRALEKFPPPSSSRPTTGEYCEIKILLACALAEQGKHAEAASQADQAVSYGREFRVPVLPNLEKIRTDLRARAGKP